MQLLATRTLRRRHFTGCLLACLAAWLLVGCQSPDQPLPRPLPANIDISTWPEIGARVAPNLTDSISIQFSRSMDPSSLTYVPRMSFLFPLTVEPLEGRWSEDTKRVAFDLSGFPVQPGTLYEAVFSGLRTRDGDLYNLGPLRFHFRTAGEPDLFPAHPHTLVASRTFCHRRGDASDCTHTSRLETEERDGNEVSWYYQCDSCPLRRRDFFRQGISRIEWLGFETLDDSGVRERNVRWTHPPVLLNLPATPGRSWQAAAQAAPDGTSLSQWKVVVRAPDSPTFELSTGGFTIDLVFSECTVFDVEYVLAQSGADAEHRRERWWMYPGVGLVRREIHSEIEARSSYELQVYTPILSEDEEPAPEPRPISG